MYSEIPAGEILTRNRAKEACKDYLATGYISISWSSISGAHWNHIWGELGAALKSTKGVFFFFYLVGYVKAWILVLLKALQRFQSRDNIKYNCSVISLPC